MVLLFDIGVMKSVMRYRVIFVLCYMFSGVWQELPKILQPQWILEVEKDELGIRAGLQDRVVQVLAVF